MYVRERIVNTRSSEKSLLKCRMTKRHFNSKGMQNLQLVQVFSEVIVSESFDLIGFNLSFVQKTKTILTQSLHLFSSKSD